MVSWTPVAAQPEVPRLQGDAEAVEAVERMVDRFGGPEVWANARSLYVEYDGWRLRPNEPVVERAWRDLDRPYLRAEYEGRSFYNVSVMTPERSFDTRNERIRHRTDAEHRQRVDRYPFSFYVAMRSFALADQRIRLEWQEPDRVVVHSEDGRNWGWWQIDGTGALIGWGVDAEAEGGSFSYVYGPMREFGNVNFPAWGASNSGDWRWTYTQVDVGRERYDISYDPPSWITTEVPSG